MVTDPGQPSRRTTALPFAAAAVLMVLAVAVTLLVGRSKGGQAFSLASSATIPSGHAHDAVVHDGDTVRGQGAVLARPGEPVRFCAPVIEGGQGGTDSVCPVYVPVTGVDLAALTDRTVVDGAVRGRAALTGTYRGGTLHVTHQAAAVDTSRPDDQPPCPAPDGGWPSGRDPDPSAANDYSAAHPGKVEIVALLRPARDEAIVYVVTAGDPNPVGDALESHYGKRLCIVRGTYSPEQIARAKQDVVARIGAGDRLTTPDGGGGPALTPSGGIMIEADVPIVDQALADAVDAQPDGLVQLTVWLRPTG